jgi:hypothetical protein
VSRIRVNTNTRHDDVILFFFLLGLPWCFAERLPEAELREPGFFLKPLLVLAGIILAVLLLRGDERRLKDCYGYQLAAAALMSLIGASVVGFPVMILSMLALMLSPFSGGWVAFVFFLPGALAAGWWCGWRFGTWGYVWGAMGALIVVAIPQARMILEEGFGWILAASWDLVSVTALPLLAGAIGGHFGARRAQRTMDAWAARHGPAPIAE